MDQATQTMIENLYKNTGTSLEDWVEIVRSQSFSKHGEAVNFLKKTHGLTHGFANLIAHKAKESDADSADSPSDLITKQYQGKEHFKPIYQELMSKIKSFGKDIEVSPKNSYVSLRRKKQFAILNPATKTRFEIGLNLKGFAASDKLEAEKPNAMCTHKICISSVEEVDKEVLDWLHIAYEKAG
ncbi:DUF4287 domain-containing protein [Penaeicola halotolerans]|jgi:predicted transport protein|uniref:DUF4287 domain-containing protein n=1 Tax=Penaeicola halotolerans TaxID=2793196 RepID=UPI001CF8AB03|nr:DUF4287 domain-containing protein [Penaeicola halotolerans]